MAALANKIAFAIFSCSKAVLIYFIHIAFSLQGIPLWALILVLMTLCFMLKHFLYKKQVLQIAEVSLNSVVPKQLFLTFLFVSCIFAYLPIAAPYIFLFISFLNTRGVTILFPFLKSCAFPNKTLMIQPAFRRRAFLIH